MGPFSKKKNQKKSRAISSLSRALKRGNSWQRKHYKKRHKSGLDGGCILSGQEERLWILAFLRPHGSRGETVEGKGGLTTEEELKLKGGKKSRAMRKQLYETCLIRKLEGKL